MERISEDSRQEALRDFGQWATEAWACAQLEQVCEDRNAFAAEASAYAGQTHMVRTFRHGGYCASNANGTIRHEPELFYSEEDYRQDLRS